MLALTGAIDLATSALFDDTRVAAGFLVGGAMVGFGAVELRPIARRLRHEPDAAEMTTGRWLWFAASSAIALAALALFGYLLGGVWLALGLSVSVIVFAALAVLVGLRKRRTLLSQEPADG
jgi:hypothetical protein